jgi:hypothetical protein
VRKLVIGTMLILLGSVAPVEASPLKDIHEVSITFIDIDEDAKKCGVSDTSPYQLIVRDELKNIGIKYKSDAEFDLRIDISMLKHDDEALCSGILHYSLERNVKDEQNLSDDFWVSSSWGWVLFYSPVLDAEDYVGQDMVTLIQYLKENIDE